LTLFDAHYFPHLNDTMVHFALTGHFTSEFHTSLLSSLRLRQISLIYTRTAEFKFKCETYSVYAQWKGSVVGTTVHRMITTREGRRTSAFR